MFFSWVDVGEISGGMRRRGVILQREELGICVVKNILKKASSNDIVGKN